VEVGEGVEDNSLWFFWEKDSGTCWRGEDAVIGKILMTSVKKIGQGRWDQPWISSPLIMVIGTRCCQTFYHPGTFESKELYRSYLTQQISLLRLRTLYRPQKQLQILRWLGLVMLAPNIQLNWSFEVSNNLLESCQEMKWSWMMNEESVIESVTYS